MTKVPLTSSFPEDLGLVSCGVSEKPAAAVIGGLLYFMVRCDKEYFVSQEL
jgi:hypothetical protein